METTGEKRGEVFAFYFSFPWSLSPLCIDRSRECPPDTYRRDPPRSESDDKLDRGVLKPDE